LPCFELFAAAPADYRKSVIGTAPRVAIEAAVRQSWDVALSPDDAFIGMSSFGASAPAGELYKKFGITVDAIVVASHAQIAANAAQKKQ
jgi:transketolase